MSFPVTANTPAFNTSPTYSGTFIPALWSGKLNAKFFANTMLTDVMNTTWEGEIKNQGDTIKIRTAPSITILDYAGPSSTLTSQVPVPDTIDLNIDKAKYFSVVTSDVLSYQSDMNLMDMFTDDAAKQLKIAIEDEVFFNAFVTEGAAAANKGATAGVRTVGYNLGTDLAPIQPSGTNAVLNVILRMSACLDEQNVPEEGRFLVLTPFDRHQLMQSSLAQAYFTGDQASTIRTGKIGMLDRFTVYVSNLLPRGIAGKTLKSGNGVTTGANGTTEVNLADALTRRMMVAGVKSACAYASQISKVETLRNPVDFGDTVRGLQVYGRKVVKNTALVTALVGIA